MTYAQSSKKAWNTEDNRYCKNNYGIHLNSLSCTPLKLKRKVENNPIFFGQNTEGREQETGKWWEAKGEITERLVRNNKALGKHANRKATSTAFGVTSSFQVPPISSDHQPQHQTRNLTPSWKTLNLFQHWTETCSLYRKAFQLQGFWHESVFLLNHTYSNGKIKFSPFSSITHFKCSEKESTIPPHLWTHWAFVHATFFLPFPSPIMFALNIYCIIPNMIGQRPRFTNAIKRS